MLYDENSEIDIVVCNQAAPIYWYVKVCNGYSRTPKDFTILMIHALLLFRAFP